MQFSLVKQQKVICGSALFSFFHTIVFFVFLVHWHGHKILSSLSLCHELIQFLTLFFLNAISPYHALFGVNFVRGIDDRLMWTHTQNSYERPFFLSTNQKKKSIFSSWCVPFIEEGIEQEYFLPKNNQTFSSLDFFFRCVKLLYSFWRISMNNDNQQCLFIPSLDIWWIFFRTLTPTPSFF